MMKKNIGIYLVIITIILFFGVLEMFRMVVYDIEYYYIFVTIVSKSVDQRVVIPNFPIFSLIGILAWELKIRKSKKI